MVFFILLGVIVAAMCCCILCTPVPAHRRYEYVYEPVAVTKVVYIDRDPPAVRSVEAKAM